MEVTKDGLCLGKKGPRSKKSGKKWLRLETAGGNGFSQLESQLISNSKVLISFVLEKYIPRTDRSIIKM
jgi:hypothetical protein